MGIRGKFRRRSTPIPITAPPVNTVAPALTGTTTVGQQMTCSSGSWTGSPTSHTYQWRRNGTNIAAATFSTYTLVSADAGATITCVVTATNVIGSAQATSNAVGPIATLAPVNTVAPAITGTIREGQTISCSTGTWLNSPTGYTYQWQRSGSNISGATTTTYALTAADVGKIITCVVLAVVSGLSASATSNAVGPVSPLPAVNTVAPVVSGTPAEGQVLSVTTGTWTSTALITYTYQWYWGALSAIPNATGQTHTLSALDVGQNVNCVVLANNGGGVTAATSNSLGPVTAIGAAPANTVLPAITGAPLEGATLTCSTGTWTNTPTAYAYQWKRAGTNISGATAATYVPVGADVGTVLTCAVTATNTSGATIATSSGTSAIVAAVPVSTSAPVVSGNVVQGQTLSTTNGTWTSSVSVTYAYQWKRGGTNIASATSATYVLVNADAASTITCEVTATNSGGSAAMTSNAVGPVIALAPVNSVAPVVTGTAGVGQTLTCSTGTWSNNPTYAFQWMRSDVAIAGSTLPTRVLTDADVGANITCVVTATNNGGSAQATSNSVGPVTSGDTLAPTITSSASVSVQEDLTLAHAMAATESVTWTIRTVSQNAASLDWDKFDISGSTLRWFNNTTRDFENPVDSNSNNAYVVVVRATDGAGNFSEQTITATVTNWTPASLSPAAVHWFDAQDAGSITQSGGTVSQWNDKGSAAANATQATEANKPSYIASSGINSKPALRTSGADNKGMTFTSSLGQLTELQLNNSLTEVIAKVGGTDRLSGSVFAALTTPSIIGVTWSTSAVTFWQNGQQMSQITGLTISAAGAIFCAADVVSTGGGTFGRFLATNRLFNRTDGLRAFDGDIGEILYLSVNPSTGDRKKIEDYLSTQWGIALWVPAPVLLRTSAAGVRPFEWTTAVDDTVKSHVYGNSWQMQTTQNGTDFSTTLQDITKPISESELISPFVQDWSGNTEPVPVNTVGGAATSFNDAAPFNAMRIRVIRTNGDPSPWSNTITI